MINKLNAEVATIGGLSAHGGQRFLLEYAQATQETIKDIFLVHGEPRAAEIFRTRLAEVGIDRVRYPAMHTTVEI